MGQERPQRPREEEPSPPHQRTELIEGTPWVRPLVGLVACETLHVARLGALGVQSSL